MSKICAIAQSNYIPWKGYFDLINSVDEFIVFDSVQYTRRDFRNRQAIKTPSGPAWLSIPLHTKGNYLAKIEEMIVTENQWAEKHWSLIRQNYRKAPYFDHYADRLKEVFEAASKETNLSKINILFLKELNALLDIRTKISVDRDYKIEGGKSERLLYLCQQLNATKYISGPSAQSYLNIDIFTQNQIAVEWMDYSNYPVYKQVHPPYAHDVSVIDLLFCEGPAFANFMKTFQTSIIETK